MNVKKVSIIGSCVTRDVFGFCQPNEWTISSFIARTSFISMTSLPVPAGISTKAHSNFETRCIIQDFEKSYWNELDLSCDYLILDFIDERFDLAVIGESIVLATQTMLGSGALSPYPDYNIIERLSPETNKLWYQSCGKICAELRKRYDPKRIILHKARHASHFLKKGKPERFDGFHAKFAAHHNDMLDRYYKYFLEQLPQSIAVQADPSFTLADDEHPWGRQPFHYQQSYYDEIMMKINSLTNSGQH